MVCFCFSLWMCIFVVLVKCIWEFSSSVRLWLCRWWGRRLMVLMVWLR